VPNKKVTLKNTPSFYNWLQEGRCLFKSEFFSVVWRYYQIVWQYWNRNLILL